MHKKGKVITGDWSVKNRKQYVMQYKLVHESSMVKARVTSRKETSLKAAKIRRNEPVKTFDINVNMNKTAPNRTKVMNKIIKPNNIIAILDVIQDILDII